MMTIVRILILTLVVCVYTDSHAQIDRIRNHEDRIRTEMTSRSFSPDSKWYNTDRVIDIGYQPNRLMFLHLWSPEALNGRNSIAVANEVRRLNTFVNMITVIRSTDAAWQDSLVVESLIDEFRINHPVVVTDDFVRLGVYTTDPSCRFIGYTTDGTSYGEFFGESIAELPQFISFVSEKGLKEQGLRNSSLFPIRSRDEIERPLHFPKSIVCSEVRGHCYLAEPENHRVLILDDSGALVDIIGSGAEGFREGRYGSCQLGYPAGLAVDDRNGLLYISDARNHVVWAVNLESTDVKYVLGNSQPSDRVTKWVDSTSASISAPTGLHFSKGQLYIAMTGLNQIWQYEPASKRAKPILGNGKQQHLDGERGMCSFDSPRLVLATSDGGMFVYDAMSKKLRRVSPEMKVATVELPEIDGVQPVVIGGMTEVSGRTTFTDTYNNRFIQFDGKSFKRLSGSGAIGSSDNKKREADFFHPSGLANLSGKLYAVERNTSSIRRIHPKKGITKRLIVSDLEQLFMGVNAFQRGHQKAIEDNFISPGLNTVFIELQLPEHLEWHDDGRNDVEIEASNFNRLVTMKPRNGFIELEVKGDELNPNVNVQLYMTVRDKRDGEIYFRTALLLLTFFVDNDSERVHDFKFQPFEDFK
jgi:sugar lactone lactonase YvrE